jgi:hypothetical protein
VPVVRLDPAEELVVVAQVDQDLRVGRDGLVQDRKRPRPQVGCVLRHFFRHILSVLYCSNGSEGTSQRYVCVGTAGVAAGRAIALTDGCRCACIASRGHVLSTVGHEPSADPDGATECYVRNENEVLNNFEGIASIKNALKEICRIFVPPDTTKLRTADSLMYYIDDSLRS